MKRQDIRLFVPFDLKKADDEQRMVYGICTSDSLDSQGEVITKDAIEKAWAGYMEYANIREMHQPSAVGVTKEYEHMDDGTHIGVKVVDDRAWKFVKEGVYKGFSIGGRVLKKNKNIISEILLYEISLVDRPANPDAKFDSYKMDGDLVERLTLEDSKNNSMLHKVIEIDGKKYKEDPANPGKPLLDADSQEPIEASAEDIAAAEAPAETEEEKAAREEKEQGDANEAAGLNRDGSAKDPAPVDPAPVDPAPVDPAPVDPAPVAAPSEEQQKAAGLRTTLKKFKQPVAKDSLGVITLASLLDHADYLGELFAMNGKDASPIEAIKATIMEMIAAEATEADTVEAAAPAGDLQKIASELSKTVLPLLEKMGAEMKADMAAITTKVDGAVADIALIKSAKVSPRPSGSAAVEKVIQQATPEGSVSSKLLAEKRAELEAISKEIDAFALEMRPKLEADPTLRDTFMSKSADLHKRYRGKQAEIQNLLHDGGVQA